MSMFPDSYKLKWKLTDGVNTWWEEHKDISLTDFEEIYGNNVHHIKYVELKPVTVIHQIKQEKEEEKVKIVDMNSLYPSGWSK
ncbi:MAG TPA: hypothetical protein VLG50_07370 [Candidatus Saccharimonadales bacterium]|nr:hypothetical protein [Candidatus Saccharimonadales bacterium]